LNPIFAPFDEIRADSTNNFRFSPMWQTGGVQGEEIAKLRFRFNASKFANAVAYLAQACPNSTKVTVCKLLYYADKKHLVRFGRPILGDRYYKLEHRPTPTHGLDMLRHRTDPAANALLDKYVSVIGNSVHPKQVADRKVFSKSDLAALEQVARKYGKLSAARLRRMSHTEAPSSDSEDCCPIDYELFFDEHPGSEEIRALAKAEQESRDVLRPYAGE
jgi:uncharacterized phage-associated protein